MSKTPRIFTEAVPRCFYCCSCAQSMCLHSRERCIYCAEREDGGPNDRDAIAERDELRDQLAATVARMEDWRNIANERTVALIKAQAADDPELDGTDGALPAFWRGQDDGVRGAARIILKALEDDDGGGVTASPDLELARRGVLAQREAIERLTALTEHAAELIEKLTEMRERGAVPCNSCGGPAPEFVVPSDAWNTIIRADGKEHGGEYLCLPCFAREAAEQIRRLKTNNGQLRDRLLLRRQEAPPSSS